MLGGVDARMCVCICFVLSYSIYKCSLRMILIIQSSDIILAINIIMILRLAPLADYSSYATSFLFLFLYFCTFYRDTRNIGNTSRSLILLPN